MLWTNFRRSRASRRDRRGQNHKADKAPAKRNQMKIVEQSLTIFYSNSRKCAGEIARPDTLGPKRGATVGNTPR
jgi:hypothetical protein